MKEEKTIKINKWGFNMDNAPAGTFILFLLIWVGGFIWLHNIKFSLISFYWLFFIPVGFLISYIKIEKKEYEIKARLKE